VIHAWQASAVGQVTPLSEVQLTDDGVTVVAEGGLEVRLGENPAAPALERLAKVQQELERRSFEAALVRLDDRARPGRVTVQLAGGSERGSRSGN
jgi:cell division septal protein FtsQ